MDKHPKDCRYSKADNTAEAEERSKLVHENTPQSWGCIVFNFARIAM